VDNDVDDFTRRPVFEAQVNSSLHGWAHDYIHACLACQCAQNDVDGIALEFTNPADARISSGDGARIERRRTSGSYYSSRLLNRRLNGRGCERRIG
jgi:hypothetical protein